MNHSLNEYEDLCKKAARGGGMHWGQAEEVGKAARILSYYGIDDGQLVLSAIECFSDKNALFLGPALCDKAIDFKKSIRLAGVESPTFILPFLQMMLTSETTCLKVTWIGFEGIVSANEIFCFRPEGIANVGPVNIEIESIETFVFQKTKRFSRVEINENILNMLNKFANRTYAPATEESRLSGAGAGLSDND